jgi:O-acetyl-ADP-ribose deacetylase (regulator of RNase III)
MNREAVIMDMADTRIDVLAGDITRQKFDAIVNSANKSLLSGDGVDGAIHRRAGKELLMECRELNGCPTGRAKITKSYKLQEQGAWWIIHAVGPRWLGGFKDEDNLLAGAYLESLKLAVNYKNTYVKQCLEVLDRYTKNMPAADKEALISEVEEEAAAYAEEHPIRSIVFPSISTGVYGFPLERAAEIAVNAIDKFLKGDNYIERVAVVCADRGTYEAYRGTIFPGISSLSAY